MNTEEREAILNELDCLVNNIRRIAEDLKSRCACNGECGEACEVHEQVRELESLIANPLQQPEQKFPVLTEDRFNVLKASGMLWEFYPEAEDTWEATRQSMYGLNGKLKSPLYVY